MRTTTGRLKPDGVSHVDQDQDCRSRPRRPCRHRHHRFHHHPGRSQGSSAGASAPAWSAPPSSAPRSPPATTATTTTAIAAAAGFASSTPTATTSAAFAPAITDDRAEIAEFASTRFLREANRPVNFAFRSKTLSSWILRPARAPHPPRAAPDPPGCPPGRVNFFGDPLRDPAARYRPTGFGGIRAFRALLSYGRPQRSCHICSPIKQETRGCFSAAGTIF